MRHIDRLPEPDILVKKHDEWQAKYDAKREADPSARPDSSKYGNPKIRERLKDCSYGKCFYCESKLGGMLNEIDHFKEVSIAPDLAYTWDNLYLSCSNCNDKINHDIIQIEAVLDPCKDSDEEIQTHVTFEDECICSQAGSVKGLNTIKKFRLNTDVLDLKRGKWLRMITNNAMDILNRMIEEGRRDMTEEEKQSLLRYMQPDQPYSLMSEIYLRKRFDYLFV